MVIVDASPFAAKNLRVHDAPMRAGLYCAKIIQPGRKNAGTTCGKLLCKIDVDHWEEALTNHAEHYCERCGNTYTLAEYR